MVVRTRKQQILFKIESSEGVDAVPDGTNGVLVYEPSFQPNREFEERAAAGGSLSKDFVPAGRNTRTVQFTSDLRGSGDTNPSGGIDEPEWGEMIRCAAFESVQPVTLPVTLVSGTGFHTGEIVQTGASVRGVVIGLFSGGNIVARLDGDGDVVIAPLEGTFTSGTLTGESSGTTGTLGTVADYDGLCYKPTSLKLVTLPTAANWTGTAPTAGDVITVRDGGGVQTAICQVVTIAGTTQDVTLLDGVVANGYTLHFGAATATISSAPTQSKTPSGTIYHNLDGRRRTLLGSRSDFELTGEAGQSLRFSWTFSGDPGTAVDEIAPSTTGLGSIRAPRLFGADGSFVTYGKTQAVGGTEQQLQMVTKSVSLAMGNTVAPDLDANSAGGARGSNVTDRDPTFGVTVNQVLGGFDWEDFADNGQAVHMGVVVGKTKGNIVGVVVPNGQVTETPTGDAEGVATYEAQVKPRRVAAGDDELYLFQL